MIPGIKSDLNGWSCERRRLSGPRPPADHTDSRVKVCDLTAHRTNGNSTPFKVASVIANINTIFVQVFTNASSDFTAVVTAVDSGVDALDPSSVCFNVIPHYDVIVVRQVGILRPEVNVTITLCRVHRILGNLPASG